MSLRDSRTSVCAIVCLCANNNTARYFFHLFHLKLNQSTPIETKLLNEVPTRSRRVSHADSLGITNVLTRFSWMSEVALDEVSYPIGYRGESAMQMPMSQHPEASRNP